MPVATVSTEFERKELSSLKGAYIKVRPLPYGHKLRRQEKAMRMGMTMESDNRAQRRGKEEKTGEERIDMEFAVYASRSIEIEYCVGEHNLTDANNQLLDLTNPMTLDVLDPRVGSEIGSILDELNGSDFDEEDFSNARSKSSLTEVPAPTAESTETT